MDYEKLHKDTITKLQEMVNSGKITVETACGICADFVPESEDEKIRKWIIIYLNNRILNSAIIEEKKNCINAIAWLEKQGEKGTNGNNREIPNSEQKPADKVEPKFKVGDTIQPKDPVLGEPRIIERIYPTWGYDTNKGILDFEFEDNWELVEQKPAWSEEDEDILNTIINHFEIDLECTENDDIIRWLKFLKDRVQPKQEWSEKYIANVFEKVGLAKIAREQGCDVLTKAIQSAMIELSKFAPQPQQEWSKEDKKMLQETIEFVEAVEEVGKNIDGFKDIKDWLKSLIPQNRRKPSMCLIDSLSTIITNPERMTDYNRNNLIELREQLKKLT